MSINNACRDALLLLLFALGAGRAAGADYRFDGSMSREVLESYLDRSITFSELLHDDLERPRNARGVDPRDNLRLLVDSGAKLVGRALMVWGREAELADFLRTAKPFAAALHEADPEMILQAAAFEIVTPGVEQIAVPDRVFAAFGLPAEARHFRYRDMLYEDGRFVGHWGRSGSVPDMSRVEARMWFYHLVTSYLDVGIEAIHFGQVGLMDRADPGHTHWIDLLTRVRAYAKGHARRHFLLCDAHAPTGGFAADGRLLFDFHSFPLRIAEVEGTPHEGVLKVGYTDAIFGRSQGGITPSGWACDHLPYLVEFDNFGRAREVGTPGTWPFVWGWDEITWFALRPEAGRNAWLKYAWNWVKATDPAGHLQMPGSRVLSPGRPGAPRWYWANTQSDVCPDGFNTEATIRELWGTGGKGE